MLKLKVSKFSTIAITECRRVSKKWFQTSINQNFKFQTKFPRYYKIYFFEFKLRQFLNTSSINLSLTAHTA